MFLPTRGQTSFLLPRSCPAPLWRGSEMTTALGASDLTLIVDRASAPASSRAVRITEWIIFAFLVYALALTFFVSTPPGLRTRLALL
jgi:hypothetical protein